MDPIRYRFPFPPSLNHYWQARRNRAGKCLSKAAKAFRSRVIQAVLVENGNRFPITLVQNLKVRITYCWPDKRVRDVDNYAKGVFDALTHARVWKDDYQVKELTVVSGEVTKGGYCDVLISEL